MDDTQIIRKYLKNNDQELFKILVDRYKDRVFRLAVSILGTHLTEEAEQVTQDVFLQVYRQLPKFRMESSFSTWLYRIAYNRAIDCKKSTRFRLPHLDEGKLSKTLTTKNSDNPVAALMTAEQREIILDCLDQLPEVYSSVLNLHYWLGHSVEEIGAYLGVPEGTVKSYLHRARKKLFVHLKKRGFEYE
jgi:RNA polymerase sigma factor (sigma-70 family)